MGLKPRVALVVETSSIYGRRLLAGITRYLRTHANWSIVLEQRSLTNRTPDWLSHWDGEGVISRATTPELAQTFFESKRPVIDLTDRHGDLGLVHIWSDDMAIGKMAAEHFSERGFQNIAFCGFSHEAWSAKRRQGFFEFFRQINIDVLCYESPWQSLGEAWEEDQRSLADWLQSLPRPIGIFCSNDVRGQQVLDCCSALGIAVPEEMAVLGVDDDALVCDLCRPSLSSVIPNPESIGFLAAETLDRWMQNKPPETQIQTVAPIGITVRQSSDIVAIDDAIVANALRLIREHACDGLGVTDLLDRLSVSRSALERRFRKAIHRSPQNEIRLQQLKKAKQLLVETDFSLPRIADLSGFEHPEYLSVIFKRLVGITPGDYRKSARSPEK